MSPLQSDFLKEFTKRLIGTAHYESVMSEEKIRTAPLIPEIKPETPKGYISSYRSLDNSLERVPGEAKIKLVEIDNQVPTFQPIMPIQKSQEQRKTVLKSLFLGKIDKYLNDPSIKEIECNGPDKPLLVYKNGKLETVEQKLTEEEIKSIIEQLVKLSKVPMNRNIVHGSHEGYEFTGVVSEFVGSRFLIRK